VIARHAAETPTGPDCRDRAAALLRLTAKAGLLAVVWAVTATCATYQIFSDCVASLSPCPAEGAGDQAAVLFLVGDAGYMEADRHPVMEHMKTAISALDQRGIPATVLFLGDNVYDVGVREDHPEDLRLLGAQVEAVVGTSARGVFRPGNHDWGNTGRDEGLARIRNQERALRDFSEATGADVGLAVPAGCPGPVLETLENARGDALATVVLLDTAWWMRPPDSTCGPSTREDVLRELERAISGAGEMPTIVAAHHPLRSGGPHGGNASSLRWLANRAGLLREDLNTPHYQSFIAALSGVLGQASRTVVYAAGHEHGLQVIDGSMEGVPLLHLVSGSGSKVTAVRPVDGSRFAAALLGYMRLDFRSGGGIQLGVVAECSVDAVEASLCSDDEMGSFQSVYRAPVR
jgi:hypothetical protein